MDSERTPSAEVLLGVALQERQLRLDSLTAMDQRAGAILGFTGALVALGTLLPRWWLQVPVYAAGAVTVFRCRRAIRVEYVAHLNPMALRRHLRKDAPDAARIVLDTLAKRHADLRDTLTAKSRAAEGALNAMVVTIAVVAVAGLVGGLL